MSQREKSWWGNDCLSATNNALFFWITACYYLHNALKRFCLPRHHKLSIKVFPTYHNFCQEHRNKVVVESIQEIEKRETSLGKWSLERVCQMTKSIDKQSWIKKCVGATNNGDQWLVDRIYSLNCGVSWRAVESDGESLGSAQWDLLLGLQQQESVTKKFNVQSCWNYIIIRNACNTHQTSNLALPILRLITLQCHFITLYVVK